MPDCHTGDATAPRRSSSWAGGRTHPAHCVTEASSCTYWPATPTRKRAGAADLSLKLTDMVDTRAVASQLAKKRTMNTQSGRPPRRQGNSRFLTFHSEASATRKELPCSDLAQRRIYWRRAVLVAPDWCGG